MTKYAIGLMEVMMVTDVEIAIQQIVFVQTATAVIHVLEFNKGENCPQGKICDRNQRSSPSGCPLCPTATCSCPPLNCPDPCTLCLRRCKYAEWYEMSCRPSKRRKWLSKMPSRREGMY